MALAADPASATSTLYGAVSQGLRGSTSNLQSTDILPRLICSSLRLRSRAVAAFATYQQKQQDSIRDCLYSATALAPSVISSQKVLQLSGLTSSRKSRNSRQGVLVRAGWPDTIEDQKEYTFNLDEYLVTLEKPIGIRFAQREDGKVYVEALAKGGNAENSRMVMLGDVLKKTSAVFGEDMWEAHDFSRVMYAIKTRSGPVSLVFERTSQALHTRGLAWNTAGKGRLAGWYPEKRASGISKRPNEVDFLAEDFIESAEDVVESTSGWGSQPHEEELAAAFESKGSAGKPGSHNYGAEAFFTQREGGFPAQGFGDIRAGAKPGAEGSGEPSMSASWTDEEVYDEFYGGGSLGAQIDPVEEYNDAMRRAGWDLEYHHSLGMNYTEVLPELLLGSCLQTPADVQVLARQLGVTAVLNLQQSSDQVNWGIDGAAINRAFREEGIRLVQHPIRDFDPRDLRHRLPVAVGALHRLLRRGHRVYVTCTAGLGRSPAVVIAFLHWHAQLSLDEAYSAIVKLRPSAPNRASIAGATWDLLAMVEEGRHKGDRSHPVRLVWNHGGRECLVVGEFGGGWSDPMAAVPIGGPCFALDLRLPPGKYRYKFIIDGQWRHAGDLPTELDEWGNINNVVHVGPNGVELGGGSSHTDIYGARSYGRMFWHTDHSAEKVLERPLTDDQRRRLTYAATRMAFSICPLTYHPKLYY